MFYVLYAGCTLVDDDLEGGAAVGAYATRDEAVEAAHEWIARTNEYVMVVLQVDDALTERVYLSTDPGEPHEDAAE
jgi:hypothetical protein